MHILHKTRPSYVKPSRPVRRVNKITEVKNTNNNKVTSSKDNKYDISHIEFEELFESQKLKHIEEFDFMKFVTKDIKIIKSKVLNETIETTITENSNEKGSNHVKIKLETIKDKLIKTIKNESEYDKSTEEELCVIDKDNYLVLLLLERLYFFKDTLETSNQHYIFKKKFIDELISQCKQKFDSDKLYFFKSYIFTWFKRHFISVFDDSCTILHKKFKETLLQYNYENISSSTENKVTVNNFIKWLLDSCEGIKSIKKNDETPTYFRLNRSHVFYHLTQLIDTEISKFFIYEDVNLNYYIIPKWLINEYIMLFHDPELFKVFYEAFEINTDDIEYSNMFNLNVITKFNPKLILDSNFFKETIDAKFMQIQEILTENRKLKKTIRNLEVSNKEINEKLYSREEILTSNYETIDNLQDEIINNKAMIEEIKKKCNMYTDIIQKAYDKIYELENNNNNTNDNTNNNVDKCCICFNNDISIIISPCNHSCCGVCASEMDFCPKCGALIEIYEKVYPLK